MFKNKKRWPMSRANHEELCNCITDMFSKNEFQLYFYQWKICNILVRLLEVCDFKPKLLLWVWHHQKKSSKFKIFVEFWCCVKCNPMENYIFYSFLLNSYLAHWICRKFKFSNKDQFNFVLTNKLFVV